MNGLGHCQELTWVECPTGRTGQTGRTNWENRRTWLEQSRTTNRVAEEEDEDEWEAGGRVGDFATKSKKTKFFNISRT